MSFTIHRITMKNSDSLTFLRIQVACRKENIQLESTSWFVSETLPVSNVAVMTNVSGSISLIISHTPLKLLQIDQDCFRTILTFPTCASVTVFYFIGIYVESAIHTRHYRTVMEVTELYCNSLSISMYYYTRIH